MEPAPGAVTPSMRIVIAGAHGQIARHLARQLVSAGHSVTGLIRNPDHGVDLEADGTTPFVADLESSAPHHLLAALEGVDAVVFAAGAGPGSSAERKDSVDRGAAVLLADAAESAGVERFIQISSMGTEAVRDGHRPDGVDDVFFAYLTAKLAAEEDLRNRGKLRWTILRPGRLTNDAPTGRVNLAAHTGSSDVPRADVADVVAELLTRRLGDRKVLELVAGETEVTDAVVELAS